MGLNTKDLMIATLACCLWLLPTSEAAAKACIHSWAIPGTYVISGNFRGKVETAGARLTRDCRVIIRVPGVFSGRKVRKAGRCLRFGFKVEGIKKAFSAKWCNKIGSLPWKGKIIRARIRLVKRPTAEVGELKKKQNFNLPK